MLASAAISAIMTTTAIAATERRLCLLGLTIAGQSLDIGCVQRPEPARRAEPKPTVYCGPKGSGKAFEPLGWSKRDTQETIEEIRAHNAAGRAMKCWK